MRNRFIILIVLALILVYVLPTGAVQDNDIDKLRTEISDQLQKLQNRQEDILEGQSKIMEQIKKVRQLVLATK